MRIVLIVLVALALGCGADLLGIGDEWTKSDCGKLDLLTFAEKYTCASEDALICHHSMLAAYHTGQAICIGLSDEDPEPAE